MQPIRKFLIRELAATLGAIVLVMVALVWMGTAWVVDTRAPMAVLRREPQLGLAVAGAVLLAFALWRVRRLAKTCEAKFEAISESVAALSRGLTPAPIASTVKEINDLGLALHKAGESIQNEIELKKQLERSQRLELMGSLTGGVAHDVNNQLAAIVGQINLAKDSLPEGHPARRRLDKAEAAVDRCSLMIKSLLGLTHQVRPRLRSTDLNTLVANTATLLERVLGGLIRIELDLASDLPPILGEPVQLEQVLMNLAVNARDAMPEGGRLRLSTAPDGPRGACLKVRDTGTGIPGEVLPRIFEPFFTTKGMGKGSGLGLAMVLKIVEAHGGRVEVDSRPGAGTEFRIHLQVPADPPEEAETGFQPPQRSYHFAGKRILVAEDDPNLRELLADAFTQARAQVETAPDGEVAWALFRQSRYDLVVSDQRMPECTGLELLGRIRAAGSPLPVILASGYGLEGMEDALARDPGLRLFSKPFAIRNIFRTAWELLEETPVTARD